MARRSYTSNNRDVSFELDGVLFTPAAISVLNTAELAKYSEFDMESPEGFAKVSEFFQDILGGDYERFKTHCGEHHTDGETIFKILQDVLEDVMGLPTQPSSESSDGPTSIGRMLRVISSEGVLREEPLSPEREAELREAVARAAG